MSDSVQDVVQSTYASVAKSGLSGSHAGVRAVAEALVVTHKSSPTKSLLPRKYV